MSDMDSMTSRWYVLLPDHSTRPAKSMDEAEAGISSESKHVALTRVGRYFRVSTVFLGLDHQHFDGPPLLFETAIIYTRPRHKRVKPPGPEWRAGLVEYGMSKRAAYNSGKRMARFSRDEYDIGARYSTWAQAELGHALAVADARERYAERRAAARRRRKGK